MKQCGTPWLPAIEPPTAPEEFIRRREPVDLALVGSLRAGSRHAHVWFDEYRKRHNASPRSVHVWIGPEGDFTATELDAIEASGARPITLGQLVLRSDTAALYCLSILNYELS
jgi:16S rRNA (uracil1498-N3)-methyltransferase